MTYYINRQANNLNISVCHRLNNKCNSIYNRIIFLTKDESNTVITKYIQSFNFKKIKYKHELNTHSNRFNYASHIIIDSQDDKHYKGQVIANYNLEQRDNKYVYNKVSIIIDETGFSGQCSYTKENEGLSSECSEGDCSNYSGSIYNPQQAVAYNNLFQYPTSGLNILLLPIDNNIFLFYNTESKLSYLTYRYR